MRPEIPEIQKTPFGAPPRTPADPPPRHHPGGGGAARSECRPALLMPSISRVPVQARRYSPDFSFLIMRKVDAAFARHVALAGAHS